MSLDLTTLRMFKKREVYTRLHRSVPARALEARTAVILADFGRYFVEHESVEVIKADPFTLWFKLVHPNLNDEEVAVYAGLFRRFDEANEPAVERGIMERLIAADSAAKVADTLERWNEGGDFDLLTALNKHVTDFEQSVFRKATSLQDLTPIEDIIAAEENEVGFRYRLSCLNSTIKPLRGGDFMVLAARPDAGKTTAVASEVTHMAPQIGRASCRERVS